MQKRGGGGWCPGSDSNRHALRRGILSPLRLPISSPGQSKKGEDYGTVSWPQTGSIEGLMDAVNPGLETLTGLDQLSDFASVLTSSGVVFLNGKVHRGKQVAE